MRGRESVGSILGWKMRAEVLQWLKGEEESRIVLQYSSSSTDEDSIQLSLPSVPPLTLVLNCLHLSYRHLDVRTLQHAALLLTRRPFLNVKFTSISY